MISLQSKEARLNEKYFAALITADLNDTYIAMRYETGARQNKPENVSISGGFSDRRAVSAGRRTRCALANLDLKAPDNGKDDFL